MSRNAARAWRYGVARASGVLARLDVARATGVRYSVRRRRESAFWEGLRPLPRDRVYAEIWRDAAQELQAEVEPVSPEILDIRRGGTVIRVKYQIVPLDGSDVLRGPVSRADDKPYVHDLLRERAIPVPVSLEYPSLRPGAALDFLRDEPACPVFVKPDAGAGGWGVTGSIGEKSQLVRASLSAARYSSRALVEREVAGDIYRLLYLDGELLDAVRRDRPTLVGDGGSTILDLVRAENDRRMAALGQAGLWLLRVDLDFLFALRRAGLALDSVLPAGQAAQVKATTAENCLSDNITVHSLAPELVGQVGTAVAALGLRLAGVDLATPDPTKPLSEGRGAVIEINENPGLTYHYLVADRERATRVALPILARCLEEAETGTRQAAAPA